MVMRKAIRGFSLHEQLNTVTAASIDLPVQNVCNTQVLLVLLVVETAFHVQTFSDLIVIRS